MFVNSTTVVFLIVIIAVLRSCVHIEAKATPTSIPSYIDDIDLSYDPQTGLWRCDRVVCPAKTFLCRITRQNYPKDPSIIVRTTHCFNRVKMASETSQYTSQSKMAAPWRVDIEINSYLGAVTDVIYGYSNSSQAVNGTVRWEDWPNVQLQYRGIILEAEKSHP